MRIKKMALLQNIRKNSSKSLASVLRLFSSNVQNPEDKLLSELKRASQDDQPVKMENPFVKEKPKCVLCMHDIEPSFRNVRLLYQFTSKYTGRLYGRHITGLCLTKHKKVEKEILKARIAGLMGIYTKDPHYFNDPKLYDELNPVRFHKYE